MVVCITRTFACTWWLLRDLSDQCEDVSFGDGPTCFDLNQCLLGDILQREVSHKDADIALQQN